MQHPITIYDIAREAGVSPSTVSRVLTGNAPVAEDKRSAVQAAIKKLRYRPSAIAQGLVHGRTGAVGVLTQSIASSFYGEIMLGVERGLAESEYHAVIASGNWRTEDELSALNLLSGRRVDALIIMPGVIADEHLSRMAEDLPVVIIGRSIAGMEDQCLRIDDLQAAHDATRYLIGLGHQRIVHIAGPRSHQDAVDRQTGYIRALTDAGLPIDQQLIIEGDYTEQSGLMAIQSLLSRGVLFSAIFAANDQMAYGARLALYRHGIRVPDDVSLVGFDDQPSSAYTTPPLTTVRQPTHDIGRVAAEAILRMLQDQPIALPAMTTELIIRESTVRRR